MYVLYTYLPLLGSRAQDQTWSDGVPMYCILVHTLLCRYTCGVGAWHVGTLCTIGSTSRI